MTSLYPIKLAATPGMWRLFSVRKVDSAFEPFRKKVFERDRYSCRYCGFQTKQYQDVINLDHNYRNNRLSNLATACCFCSQCFFLEAVGKDDYGGGVLIYLPEVSQGDLNGFCHVLFCAMSNVTHYTSEAQNIYRDLKARSKLVENYLGEGISDPAMFGRMLIDASAENRKKIEQEILTSLRLLPSYSKFSGQVRAWDSDTTDDLAI